MFTDFYRILGKRLPDCLQIFTGFWGGGFRFVYGFSPDFGEEACGLLTEFDRILGRKTSGLFTDFYRILRRRLPDCLRIFTGLWGGGFRIVYGILPNLVEQAYGLFTDFTLIWGMRLTDCFRNFTEFGGGGSRIYRIWRRRLTDLEAYGFGTGEVWVLKP